MVNQRWILIYSQDAYEQECKTLDKRIKHQEIELQKRIKSLEKELFSCEKDLQIAVKKLQKTVRYHRLDYQIHHKHQYANQGRPKQGASPKVIYYQATCTLLQDDE